MKIERKKERVVGFVQNQTKCCPGLGGPRFLSGSRSWNPFCRNRWFLVAGSRIDLRAFLIYTSVWDMENTWKCRMASLYPVFRIRPRFPGGPSTWNPFRRNRLFLVAESRTDLCAFLIYVNVWYIENTWKCRMASLYLVCRMGPRFPGGPSTWNPFRRNQLFLVAESMTDLCACLIDTKTL